LLLLLFSTATAVSELKSEVVAASRVQPGAQQSSV
jgi:hypothetical protein